MPSEKVWSKICAVAVFLFANYATLNLIFFIFLPPVLGSQFDKEYIKSIDTEFITNEYDRFDHYYEQKDGTIEVYDSDNSNGRNVRIEIFIYKDNIYSSESKSKIFWKGSNSFLFPDFDTVNVIEKNNIKIEVVEYSKTPRSKKAQAYLEEVLAQLES